ncbi:MAG: type II toxin-antitoxin system VapC family toxin [Polyangiaceae bacterium]|jgi:predicted nucleic acid-binding protein
MPTYFDSGVIVKLYVPEPNSADAIRLVTALPPPIPFTDWQAIEVRNAMRLKRFRGEITPAQLRAALRALAEDERAGRWQRPALDLGETLRRAEVFSRKLAPAIGCRTLDILHVATAVVLGVREFASFDGRQRQLAKKAGLRVVPR